MAAALEIIDEEGLGALRMRRLGARLGVNGTSLYHYFKSKDDILRGVRRLVLEELSTPDVSQATELDWREWVISTCLRFRTILARHPNVAPLMLHVYPRTMGLDVYDFAAGLLLDAGVPDDLVYPILDSMETFAFGAAMMQSPIDATTADEWFVLSARALLAGWEVRMAS